MSCSPHKPKLLGNLHAARAINAFERRFQSLVKIPLIIIDDFGLKPMRSPHDEDFHNLIDERYENSATIVTSNLDFGEWGDAFPNKLLGAATLDRLRHAAYRLHSAPMLAADRYLITKNSHMF